LTLCQKRLPESVPNRTSVGTGIYMGKGSTSMEKAADGPYVDFMIFTMSSGIFWIHPHI
jgi:hypothetical protein